jgi:enoyl-CoA hydratase/carnithine racemase
VAERIRFEQEGDVGQIVVEAPPLNLFGEGMGEELQEALAQAEGAGLRALVFRAEGKVFTGGVDVQVFEGLTSADGEGLAQELLSITRRVEEMPFPTISSVGGLCLTWGFELSLACDLIVAADAARFGLVERVVGITPFMGGVQRVAERAGPARARELVMTGDLYPAETLRQWNVLNRVVPLVELEEHTRELAQNLAAGPTLAMAATKRIVRAQVDQGTRGADEATPGIAAPLFDTDDTKRAIKTFLEEGPGNATFEGR